MSHFISEEVRDRLIRERFLFPITFDSAPIMVYVDDERKTPEGWVRAYSVEEAIRLLLTTNVTVLSMDNDLGWNDLIDKPHPEGRKVLEWIEEMVVTAGFVPPEIVVHSQNAVAASAMRATIASIQRLSEKDDTGS